MTTDKTEGPSARLEQKARELYEASRRRVSGRPKWERLNPDDPYDMGMREYAFEEAREALGVSS